jgi:hypothetical protein
MSVRLHSLPSGFIPPLAALHQRIFPVDREEAEARGIAWLRSCLTPAQLTDYVRTRSFIVIGGTTGHCYRICWGTIQNIIRTEMLDGREIPVERLCFGPRGVPLGDVLLQQKIALEGDEEATLRIAGRAPVDRASGFGWNVDGQRAGGPEREELA